ncbi:hypothetical protein [Rubritalea tangerina]|uniref:hypothetical protein n=1 Tax=Rubritalea tangerina TaxID=430798 RepID=UPI0036225AAB
MGSDIFFDKSRRNMLNWSPYGPLAIGSFLSSISLLTLMAPSSFPSTRKAMR